MTCAGKSETFILLMSQNCLKLSKILAVQAVEFTGTSLGRHFQVVASLHDFTVVCESISSPIHPECITRVKAN